MSKESQVLLHLNSCRSRYLSMIEKAIQVLNLQKEANIESYRKEADRKNLELSKKWYLRWWKPKPLTRAEVEDDCWHMIHYFNMRVQKLRDLRELIKNPGIECLSVEGDLINLIYRSAKEYNNGV